MQLYLEHHKFESASVKDHIAQKSWTSGRIFDVSIILQAIGNVKLTLDANNPWPPIRMKKRVFFKV